MLIRLISQISRLRFLPSARVLSFGLPAQAATDQDFSPDMSEILLLASDILEDISKGHQPFPPPFKYFGMGAAELPHSRKQYIFHKILGLTKTPVKNPAIDIETEKSLSLRVYDALAINILHAAYHAYCVAYKIDLDNITLPSQNRDLVNIEWVFTTYLKYIHFSTILCLANERPDITDYDLDVNLDETLDFPDTSDKRMREAFAHQARHWKTTLETLITAFSRCSLDSRQNITGRSISQPRF